MAPIPPTLRPALLLLLCVACSDPAPPDPGDSPYFDPPAVEFGMVSGAQTLGLFDVYNEFSEPIWLTGYEIIGFGRGGFLLTNEAGDAAPLLPGVLPPNTSQRFGVVAVGDDPEVAGNLMATLRLYASTEAAWLGGSCSGTEVMPTSRSLTRDLFLSGSFGCDQDGDGAQAPLCGGDDCNDTNPDIFPGNSEICGNWVDEDCDGYDAACVQ